MPLPFARYYPGLLRRLRAEETRALGRRAAPVLVFLVALWVRLSFLGEHPIDSYLVGDMAFYDARARHLLSGDQAIRDTFTPVGYPAVIAAFHAAFARSYDAIGVFQALLGAATCTLVYALTLRLTRSTWASLAAGLCLAYYLPAVVYVGFLMTETLFAFLVALFVWLLFRAMDRPALPRAALAGLALGGAIAVRPNLVVALPFLALLGWRLRPARAARAPLWAIAFALPILAAVSLHNSRLAGRPAGLATNGGLNFFLGHCQCRAVSFPKGNYYGEVNGYHNRKRYAEVVRASRPPWDEAYFYREGIRLLWERPITGLQNVGDGLVLTNLGPWPAQPYWPGWMTHEDELRAFGRGIAWLAVVPVLVHTMWLLARRRLFRPREAPRLVLLALLGSMVLTLFFYLGDPRLRVSFDPVLLVLAADAWRRAAAAALRW